MIKNWLLLSALIHFVTVSSAEELIGIFEIPQVEGEERDTVKVEVTIHDDGTTSSRVLIGGMISSSSAGGTEPDFSSEMLLETGQFQQIWRVSLEKDEVTIIVKEVREKQSQEHTWTGKLTYDLEGTFEFPPPEGKPGDIIRVRLFKNDEVDYSAHVLLPNETVHATNVEVVENQFTFNTSTNTPDGEMFQSWSVKITNGKIKLAELSDTASSISREGRFVEKEFAGEISTFEIRGPLLIDLLRHFSGTLEDSWLVDDPYETIKVEIRRDTMGNYSVQVSLERQTIDATNVKVSGNVFSFDTKFDSVIGSKSWSWKNTVEEDEITVSLSSNEETETQPVILSGRLLEKDDATNVKFGQTSPENNETPKSTQDSTESVELSP